MKRSTVLQPDLNCYIQKTYLSADVINVIRKRPEEKDGGSLLEWDGESL